MRVGASRKETTMKKIAQKQTQSDLEGIIERVKERVFGQDEAVEKICSLIDISKKRYEIISNNNLHECDKPAFCSALLVGTSGSGKSYMMKNIAEEEGMIFWPVDATTITATGWRGGNMNTEWKRLASKMNEEKGKMALVFIDEADKIMRKQDERWDAGQAKWDMLKPLEGGNVTIQDDKDVFAIDFDRCCVVFAGAFTGIERRREVAPSIGFNTPLQVEKNERGDVMREDLVKWGAPRELIGRLSLVMNLNELGKTDYERILNEQILKKYSILAPNFKLDVDESAVKAFTDEALEQKLGARCINQRINDVFTAQIWPKVSAMNGKGCIATISFKDGEFKSSCKRSNKVKSELANTSKIDVKRGNDCAKLIRSSMYKSRTVWNCDPQHFLFNDIFEYLRLLEQDSRNLVWENGEATINICFSDAEIDLLYCVICCLKYYCDIEEYDTKSIKKLLGMSKINCKDQSPLDKALSNMDSHHRNEREIDAWITEDGVVKQGKDDELCYEAYEAPDDFDDVGTKVSIPCVDEAEYAHQVFQEYLKFSREERDEAVKTACWRLM